MDDMNTGVEELYQLLSTKLSDYDVEFGDDLTPLEEDIYIWKSV